MDDTASLVSDLLQKLTELDNKVNEYRNDMGQEFRRYSQQRLQDVPGDVSAKVERLIAEQFQNYPALSPALDHVLDSPFQFQSQPQSQIDIHTVGPEVEKAWTARDSPPPLSPQSPASPSDDGASSPHEREREFHGLFTPSYLPLLDAVPRRTPTPPTLPIQIPEVKEPNSDENTSPTTLTNVILGRPDPVRRHTEDTISSVTSDDSAARLRRSALRRSSSSSIKTQSPRRVRFDVEGEEVLPTSSPPISPRAPEFPPSPLGNPTNLLDESYNAILVNDDTDLLGSSPPMPKKITSTDRLKAMARSSTEDTSKWEVVGNLEATDDDEEDELVIAGLNERRGYDTSQTVVDTIGTESTAHRINDARLPTQLGAPLAAVKETEEEEVNKETGDVDDVLMMPPLSSFKNKKRFSPPLETTSESTLEGRDSQQPTEQRNEAKEPSKPNNDSTLDEEDMFEFDDNQDTPSNNRTEEAKSIKKYIEEEEEDDEADATPIAENPTLFSTSASIPVAKPVDPAPAPSSPPHVAASAGSYRGKSFSIGIVRDPELHKKAEEMGDFYTFVGSVDGRSGVDESSSYRPELTYFNGTPRSLSERLIQEDLEEARRNTQAKDDD
ncbi:uncharacterized protein F4822DRAFT_16175 [Hypoxylon trugodes]|uniref:uncharacterized protein n=1 Tax=Hypoxylon trugodes TaxID=326681 RepID=UPI00218F9425|nr:uncharacterized protein F4822DRAFT_16175 [Hypoxylon trugodes]KAI1393547.1 hypothetical protein F4822DRAFT_16175 [Hypoxylon trugodes]